MFLFHPPSSLYIACFLIVSLIWFMPSEAIDWTVGYVICLSLIYGKGSCNPQRVL